MSGKVKKGGFLQNYLVLIIMIAAIIAGCIVGAIFPKVSEDTIEIRPAEINSICSVHEWNDGVLDNETGATKFTCSTCSAEKFECSDEKHTWGPAEDGAYTCAVCKSVKTVSTEVIKEGATVLAPLGKIFINLMFCIVVPMVFASIAGAVANMGNRKRAGKIMATTIITFVVTGLIAALIMFGLMEIFPPVLEKWTDTATAKMGESATIAELVVNFFTAEDFVGLLSRKAMLPLIVFSILFGFAVNLNGGKDSIVGKFLEDLSNVMMKVVKIVSYYAPIAFFGFFADLVATYGPQITADYGRALAVYYPLCFVYLFTAFPLFAWIGGGKHGPKAMFKHLLRPAMVSLGTCSSVATIPTNMEAAEDTGISKDVADIVLPLGATMHMDGSCFSCVLKIAFVMGVVGTPITLENLIPILLVAVFSSVGMSGVPGGGYIGEYIICSIFFADQMELAFPILVTIGNLVDPPATMINSAGDYVVSFIVSRFVDGKDWLVKHLSKNKEATQEATEITAE